jgi:hypothetical protein
VDSHSVGFYREFCVGPVCKSVGRHGRSKRRASQRMYVSGETEFRWDLRILVCPVCADIMYVLPLLHAQCFIV